MLTKQGKPTYEHKRTSFVQLMIECYVFCSLAGVLHWGLVAVLQLR